MSNCAICDLVIDEGITLLDGRVLHSECLERLKNRAEPYKEKVRRLDEEVFQINRECSRVLNERSFFKKLFNEIPPKVYSLEESKKPILEEIESLKKTIEWEEGQIDTALTQFYDYWPERPPDWWTRSFIARSGHSSCPECGRLPSKYNPLQAHHIIPISKGGDHTYTNLEVLCMNCHEKKHSHSFGSFRGYSGRNKAIKAKLDTIQHCINKNKYLEFFNKLKDGPKERHYVKVLEINYDRGVRFKAFCYLNNAEKSFLVNNISRLESFDSPPQGKVPSDYISEAIENGLMTHCRYRKSNGDESIRTLQPTGYTTYKGVKVLNCFDYLTDEYRNFSPHRMSKIELVEEPKEQKIISGTA